MAGNIDSQLKQMSKDLKMIIEQMNESNTSNDEENPVSIIHMVGYPVASAHGVLCTSKGVILMFFLDLVYIYKSHYYT